MSCDDCCFPYSLCQCPEVLAARAEKLECERLERQRTRHELARYWGVDYTRVIRRQDGTWGMR